jgi:hypothetical protein
MSRMRELHLNIRLQALNFKPDSLFPDDFNIKEALMVKMHKLKQLLPIV